MREAQSGKVLGAAQFSCLALAITSALTSSRIWSRTMAGTYCTRTSPLAAGTAATLARACTASLSAWSIRAWAWSCLSTPCCTSRRIRLIVAFCDGAGVCATAGPTAAATTRPTARVNRFTEHIMDLPLLLVSRAS